MRNQLYVYDFLFLINCSLDYIAATINDDDDDDIIGCMFYFFQILFVERFALSESPHNLRMVIHSSIDLRMSSM